MSRRLRRVAIAGSGLSALLCFSGTAMASLFGTLLAGHPPATLGVRDGKLSHCPDRPNCVSSEDTDAQHRIAPLPFKEAPAAAMARLAEVIRAMPGLAIVTVQPDYIHAEFASTVFGFVDDVEFAMIPGVNTIAVRSGARLGYGDFGVNRKRIESIRAAFAAGNG
jgi:uncharacterized protein (DUF1499 family)